MPNPVHPPKSFPPVPPRDLRDGEDMSTPPPAEPAGSNRQPATPGEILRTARQATNLSLGDVANRLRMGVKQVEALERDDYAALPQGTFLRGFVRNYAKVVHADADRVIALLENSHEAARAYRGPNIVVPTQNIEVALPGGRLATPKTRYGLIAFVALLVAAAAWYWWKFILNPAPSGSAATSTSPDNRDTTNTVPVLPPQLSMSTPSVDSASAPASTTPPPATVAVTAAPPVMPPVPPPSTPAPVVRAAPAEVAPAPVSAPTQVSPAAPTRTDAPQAGSAARGVLGFTFAGDSWVEVIDATGRTVLQAKYKAGDAEEVTGRPPFSIVVGNAPATRMAYNGKEFDLTPHTKVTTARVKLK